MDRDMPTSAKRRSVSNGINDRLIPMQLPWGEKADFQGVIDLVTMKAYKGDGKTATEIPAELKDEAEEARMVLVEAAAEGEDTLLEKYFENGDLTSEEIVQGLRKAIQESNIIPVLTAAGGHMIGVGPLMEALLALAPSPAERPAVVANSPKGDGIAFDDAASWQFMSGETTADSFVGRQTFFRVYSHGNL